jgi:hypothetical protein
MEQFLDTYVLPNLNQEDRNSQNRAIKRNEMEAVIKSANKEKTSSVDSLMNPANL